MSENKQAMMRGELYYAFTRELIKERTACKHAVHRFNTAGEVTRRRRVELWRDIVGDKRPMPPQNPNEYEDAALFDSDPWVEAPVSIDYGTNLKVAPHVFINFNCTVLDTCTVSIGARTLLAPNVSFFSGTHPLDPALRNGTAGPELGGEIHVEEDCWIGGNVTILPGVRIGRGSTVGAGSVVTKDVAPFTVVAGNPARFLRKVDTAMNPEQSHESKEKKSWDAVVRARQPTAEAAVDSEGQQP